MVYETVPFDTSIFVSLSDIVVFANTGNSYANTQNEIFQ